MRFIVASISSMWRIQSEQVLDLQPSHYRPLRHIFFNNFALTELLDEMVVNLRGWTCYLFSLLRIHRPNCKHCKIRDAQWVEVKKRLEELR